MRVFIGLLLAAVLAAPGHAQPETKLPKAPAFVSSADRATQTGRAGQIEIAQTEFGTTVELGRVMFQYSGGLLWYNSDKRR